ncbi:MAG: A/G-specific adenine glycosylase [Gammaproteobacteria bacterium]|nr:A/G-specific adenine glycosylase [Gammaproteobacteria bacterium]
MLPRIKAEFAAKLLQWFDQSGRKELPWQIKRSPYRVWVAEIMLQQTQVATVVPYFERFIQRFPNIGELAAAQLDEVLHYWSGLGYYARGRNLAKAAKLIVEQHQGCFPDNLDALQSLPGIGRSTAAAILAQAFGQRQAILDGNVKRVLARYFVVAGWPGEKGVSEQLWRYAEELTPVERVADYTQAIMDLGALVCTRSRPNCPVCPVHAHCQARQTSNAEAFPSPKPKRKAPLRAVQMLVLHNDRGEVLLQRRPPSGIWGGLLSFPEISLEQVVPEWCQQNIGPITGISRRPPLQHVFSHFRLLIHPVFARLTNLKPQIRDDDGWQWYQPGISVVGLAAPVKGLIEQWVDELEAAV